MPKRQSVSVNADEWSAASKRSAIFGFPPEEYHDKPYHCYNCKREAVFTAEEQKEAFEVRKVYIWQQRRLCQECYQRRLALEGEVEAFNIRWNTSRAELQSNREALKHWHHLLEQLPYYGAHPNRGHLAMLERLLSNGA